MLQPQSCLPSFASHITPRVPQRDCQKTVLHTSSRSTRSFPQRPSASLPSRKQSRRKLFPFCGVRWASREQGSVCRYAPKSRMNRRNCLACSERILLYTALRFSVLQRQPLAVPAARLHPTPKHHPARQVSAYENAATRLKINSSFLKRCRG